MYFVHLSAKEALKHVVEARDMGVPVFAETCPHYLFFDDSAYDSEDFDLAALRDEPAAALQGVAAGAVDRAARPTTCSWSRLTTAPSA